MPDFEPYPTSAGVEAAIKDAAKKAATNDPSLDTNERIRLEYFNRFLSRVFSEGDGSEWVLKGGTSMLARLPSGRMTRDVDLYRRGFELDDALTDLRRLAAIDLGDHFMFQYVGHEDSIGGDEQPYTEGYEVSFEVLIGGRRRHVLKVDLSVGAGVTDEIVTTEPATALNLPRLVSHDYRLYPVVDQIADKVCATMTDYDGSQSSREKDLVDLVVFATTQEIDGTALRIAIATEAGRRQLQPFDCLIVPSSWGRGYAKLAKSVPYCADYRTAELASELATHLIDPALSGAADGKTWDSAHLGWQ